MSINTVSRLTEIVAIMQDDEKCLENNVLWASRGHLFNETGEERQAAKQSAVADETARKYIERYRNQLQKLLSEIRQEEPPR